MDSAPFPHGRVPFLAAYGVPPRPVPAALDETMVNEPSGLIFRLGARKPLIEEMLDSQTSIQSLMETVKTFAIEPRDPDEVRMENNRAALGTVMTEDGNDPIDPDTVRSLAGSAVTLLTKYDIDDPDPDDVRCAGPMLETLLTRTLDPADPDEIRVANLLALSTVETATEDNPDPDLVRCFAPGDGAGQA